MSSFRDPKYGRKDAHQPRSSVEDDDVVAFNANTPIETYSWPRVVLSA